MAETKPAPVPQPPPEADEPVRSYFSVTHGFFASVVLVAPLWTAYQVGILTTDGWRNGVDFVTPKLYDLVGGNRLAYFGVNLVALAGLLIAGQLLRKDQKPSLRDFGMVLVESTAYASVMGLLIAEALRAIGLEPPALGTTVSASLSALDNLVLSLGAGAYEELVFRLGLLTAIAAVAKSLGVDPFPRMLLAFVLSSLVFSAFHYVPFGADSWQLWSFGFRFVAGLFFAALFVVRGFAVAVYTHAIYDIFVLVL